MVAIPTSGYGCQYDEYGELSVRARHAFADVIQPRGDEQTRLHETVSRLSCGGPGILFVSELRREDVRGYCVELTVFSSPARNTVSDENGENRPIDADSC